MKKRPTKATVTVEMGQLLCGRSCGDHGPESTRILAPRYKRTPDGTGHLYGLPIHEVLGEQLGEGSIIKVTVEVIERKPLKKNPWLFHANGRRKRH